MSLIDSDFVWINVIIIMARHDHVSPT